MCIRRGFSRSSSLKQSAACEEKTSKESCGARLPGDQTTKVDGGKGNDIHHDMEKASDRKSNQTFAQCGSGRSLSPKQVSGGPDEAAEGVLEQHLQEDQASHADGSREDGCSFDEGSDEQSDRTFIQ